MRFSVLYRCDKRSGRASCIVANKLCFKIGGGERGESKIGC